VTVKMPFSIDALTSLGCKSARNSSGTTPHRKDSGTSEKKPGAYLGAFRQPDGPNELAEFALLDGEPLLVLLGLLSSLRRDGKVSVLNVDMDLVLGETRQLESRSHLVLVGALVQVHPTPQESARAENS